MVTVLHFLSVTCMNIIRPHPVRPNNEGLVVAKAITGAWLTGEVLQRR